MMLYRSCVLTLMTFDQEWTHRERLIVDFDSDYSLKCKEKASREGEAFIDSPFIEAER